MGILDDQLRVKEPRQRTERPFTGAFPGKVTKATATQLWFTLDDYSRVHEFGPAPYQRPTEALDNPEKGTVVLVEFAQGDPGRPYVVAVYGWSA